MFYCLQSYFTTLIFFKQYLQFDGFLTEKCPYIYTGVLSKSSSFKACFIVKNKLDIMFLETHLKMWTVPCRVDSTSTDGLVGLLESLEEMGQSGDLKHKMSIKHDITTLKVRYMPLDYVSVTRWCHYQ